jgi:hypothetical protein
MRNGHRNRCPVTRIHCVIVDLTLGDGNPYVDPYMLQVIEQVSRRALRAEAPTPLEFEPTEWEPTSDENYERRLADDEPWDLP